MDAAIAEAIELKNQGQRARAIEVLGKARRSRAGLPSYGLNVLGMLHGARGDFSRAVKILKSSVAMKPIGQLGSRMLFICLRGQGRLADALLEAKRFVKATRRIRGRYGGVDMLRSEYLRILRSRSDRTRYARAFEFGGVPETAAGLGREAPAHAKSERRGSTSP